jgi:hypothetical protein
VELKRRLFLTAFMPGAAFAGVSFMSVASSLADAAPARSQNPNQSQRQVPNNPNQPGLIPPAIPPSSAQLRQNQRDIRKDVDELFSLAQELKTLAAKSDAAQELSVGLIQKTEEIEKLAKKIRDLARS